MTAECTTEIGAFQFPLASGDVPSKSNVAEPVAGSIVMLSAIAEPSSM